MTTLEQVAVMAIGVVEAVEADTDVVFTIRRVARAQMDGARWTATVGRYSSKAARDPETALEEVAGMLRSELLCNIEKMAAKLERARAAVPADPPSELPSNKPGPT